MPNIDNSGRGLIRVADITIAQLSRGLYRSTATAFKELVSNSFDADARVVRIDTNFPEFDFISCVDDGSGMPLESFLRFFKEEGIGSSIKRKKGKDVTSIYKRPVIGRLGIGMLAIGQLCHSFEIESHYIDPTNNQGKAYWARIILADESIPDKEEFLRNSNLVKREVEVGEWEYKIIDFDKEKKGFRIYSTDVRKTFTSEMKESITSNDLNKLSFSLEELHRNFFAKRKKSIRDCKPYLETIWELSVLCPLPYFGEIDQFPFQLKTFGEEAKQSEEYKKVIELIKERQQKFLSYNFEVIFDGIDLRRLIQFPTEENITPQLYYISFDDEVFGSRLKFEGYIFSQIPRAIKPLELNGIQIRLRGVGIGGYDSTFLKYYKQIETIRNRWVSAELFVDVGLESALNIDRDSFNEHDEHFKKLQEVFHDKLDQVFDEADKISRQLSEKKRSQKEKTVKTSLKQLVKKYSNGKLKLLQVDKGENAPIVEFHPERKEIIFNATSSVLRHLNLWV